MLAASRMFPTAAVPRAASTRASEVQNDEREPKRRDSKPLPFRRSRHASLPARSRRRSGCLLPRTVARTTLANPHFGAGVHPRGLVDGLPARNGAWRRHSCYPQESSQHFLRAVNRFELKRHTRFRGARSHQERFRSMGCCTGGPRRYVATSLTVAAAGAES
jgi:hypothetical protein